MNSLHDCALEYLTMRRALGFKMKKYEGWLLDFAAFMERRRAVRITVRLALKWAQQTRSADQNYRASRLRAIRGFARYRNLIDPRTEIPPPDLLPTQRRRFQPYLYSEDEIADCQFAASAFCDEHFSLGSFHAFWFAERNGAARQRGAEP